MLITASADYKQRSMFEVSVADKSLTLSVGKQDRDSQQDFFSPLELFLSSLATCLGVYAKRYLDRHEISFQHLHITVKAQLSQDSPKRLVDICAQVHTDAVLDKKTAVFLNFVKACPIHNTIIHMQNITTELFQE